MTPAATPTGTFTVVREWAGYNGDPPNHDKIWYGVCTFCPTPSARGAAPQGPAIL